MFRIDRLVLKFALLLFSIDVFCFGCLTEACVSIKPQSIEIWNIMRFRLKWMLWRHHSHFNKSNSNRVLKMRLAWNGYLHSYSFWTFVWKQTKKLTIIRISKGKIKENYYFYLLLSQPVCFFMCDVRSCWITH